MKKFEGAAGEVQGTLSLSKETLQSFGKPMILRSATTYSGECATAPAHTSTCPDSCTLQCSCCTST